MSVSYGSSSIQFLIETSIVHTLVPLEHSNWLICDFSARCFALIGFGLMLAMISALVWLQKITFSFNLYGKQNEWESHFEVINVLTENTWIPFYLLQFVLSVRLQNKIAFKWILNRYSVKSCKLEPSRDYTYQYWELM